MSHKKSTFSNLTKEEFAANFAKLSSKYRVEDTKKFKLKNFDTIAHFGLGKDEKEDSQKMLKMGTDLLSQLQSILYAQDRWGLLLIFQAMDAAGKDGAIKHVMSGVDPQGCQVTSFKSPSAEEIDHDYLWRCQKHLPERGRIGIFNRSYYEEVLIVKVHEEILHSQKIPAKLVTKSIWENRYEEMRNFEQYLSNNGIVVVKFFLNVSKDVQKERFLDRIENPAKNWKFSVGDIEERKYWKQYHKAYEEMIKETATEKSPWYVVPADNKALARVVISSAIVNALNDMKLAYPQVSKEKLEELHKIKAQLLAEE